MTVCIAALFQWNFAQPDEPERLAHVGIAVSDRMFTSADSQYEPFQQKLALLTHRVIVLVAGDISIHSQALIETRKQVESRPDALPVEVAQIYGRAIQSIKRKQAEDLFLAPLGLNTDTFLAQTKDMSDSFVNGLASQMQDYRGQDVDAIVVGSDGEQSHLYVVNTQGVVTCANDVGFAAIGIGAWHASSSLQQARYVRAFRFAPAMAALFAAKKSAEAAPGVGKTTDINLVFPSSVERIKHDVELQLEENYNRFVTQRDKITTESIQKLQTYIESTKPIAVVRTDVKEDGVGGNAKSNAGASEPPSEASRGNESQKTTAGEAAE